MCELLGYSREELLGMTVKQVSHPDDKSVADKVRAQLRAGEIDSFQLEKRYLRKDGATVWVQITISVQRDSAGRPGNDISIVQDITARKQAEFAVQRSEQRFRSLVELSSDWYWELDADLRFTAFGGRDMGDKYEQLLRGRLAWEIPGADSDVGWADLRARLERRESFRDFEYAYADQHGQPPPHQRQRRAAARRATAASRATAACRATSRRASRPRSASSTWPRTTA